jgi:predicted acetyltransferase
MRASFLAAMREFEGGTADADGLSVADLSLGECFETYVRSMNEGALAWQRTYVGALVRCWWWVVDGEFIGRISVRPDLTPGVPDGNHVGYAVRPSRRRQGHATAMLAAVLPVAFHLGINPVNRLTATRDGRCHYGEPGAHGTR